MSRKKQSIYSNGGVVPVTKTISTVSNSFSISTNTGMPIFEVPIIEDTTIVLVWEPKEDITTYELAKAIPYISNHPLKVGIECEVYDGFEPEIKRHFGISDDSLEVWGKYLRGKNINLLQKKL